jgi:hypothetical protein
MPYSNAGLARPHVTAIAGLLKRALQAVRRIVGRR